MIPCVMDESQLYDLLSQHKISYRRYSHPAVFTCEEAAAHLQHVPGTATKNLFLRDKKGERHALVSVRDETIVDLKALSERIGLSKLSFASPERLQKFLGVEPGSVTILGLLNDTTHGVEFYVDSTVWASDEIQCHPLVNTATLVLSRGELERVLQVSGHNAQVIELTTPR